MGIPPKKYVHGQKTHEKTLKTLVTREIHHIKKYFTITTKCTIKNIENTKCWQECGEI